MLECASLLKHEMVSQAQLTTSIADIDQIQTRRHSWENKQVKQTALFLKSVF